MSTDVSMREKLRFFAYRKVTTYRITLMSWNSLVMRDVVNDVDSIFKMDGVLLQDIHLFWQYVRLLPLKVRS